MQIQRLFVDPNSIDTANGEVLISDEQQANQLLNVLRLRQGDTVDILDGTGNLYRCAIESIGLRNRSCRLSISSTKNVLDSEPSIDLTIALSSLKSNRFEWALEKLTEIGAKRIIPIQARRSVVRLVESEKETARGASKKMARWNSIVRESAEQCERGMIPDVVAPIELEEYLKTYSAVKQGRLLICTERSDAIALGKLLTAGATISGEASLVVLVGPEGGFTENELALAAAHQAQPVSLGKRILRAETAAVYATSIIMSHLDKQR